MPLDWTPFVDFVQRHQRLLLTTHIRPDGDALGSMLGLAHILRRRGKEVRTVVASSVAPRYDFLDPGRSVQHFQLPGDEYRATDAVIVLDTSAWSQLGDFGTFLKTLAVPRLVIDHHQTQDDLGAVRLVDTSAEATGRLVFEALTALGEPLDERVATLLFVALAMDTGWFRHSNTTAATHELAAKLVAGGARPDPLYDYLFERNSLARLKLMGLVLDRLTAEFGGRAAWSEIRKSDYETTGAVPQDTEDLVNYMRSVTGVEIGLILMEQPRGGVKVSFRSRQYLDVAKLAEQFGGGGHRRAAACTVPSSLDEARRRVLAAVGSALDNHGAS